MIKGGNRKGFMIPMFFILVIALAVMVGSITYLTVTGIRTLGPRVSEQKALYIAEAGVNKAVWYLTTPVGEGGRGSDWRTALTTEAFGGGSYTLAVEDHAQGIKITSTGRHREAARTVQALAGEDFADDFIRYAIFSDVDFTMDTLSEISGDVFADGDVAVPAGARVVDGVVVVTEGHAVTGDGEYTVGELITTPGPPSLDTTYYDGQIAVAEAAGPSVMQGYQTYNGLELNGLTLYVDGGITLDGDITGAGEIVATGAVNISPTANIGEKIKIITAGDVNIKATKSDSPALGRGVVLYAAGNINIMASFTNPEPIAMLSSQTINIGNKNQVNGLIFGGNVNIGNNTTVQGVSICGNTGTVSYLADSSTVTYNKYQGAVPPGFKSRIAFEKWLSR